MSKCLAHIHVVFNLYSQANSVIEFKETKNSKCFHLISKLMLNLLYKLHQHTNTHTFPHTLRNTKFYCKNRYELISLKC